MSRELHSFKNALFEGLNVLKDFDVGCSSCANDVIAVEHKGNVFILNIEVSQFDLERTVRNL